MSKRILFLCTIYLLFGFQTFDHQTYVPDEAAAIKIAEAVLTPLFGEENVIAHRPYKATLMYDSIWMVGGPHYEHQIKPEDTIGGKKPPIYINWGPWLHVEMRKSDGKIIKAIQVR